MSSACWPMPAAAAELSVHTIGCRWIGQQGMVKDRFHIHRLMPEPELVEMAEYAVIDEPVPVPQAVTGRAVR